MASADWRGYCCNWLGLVLIATAPAATLAAPPDAEALEFFEKKIRPVLVQHCYACHSADSNKLKGGLRLDTRPGLLQGGENGPVIIPGKPERSLLLRALRYEGPKMPPKAPLPQHVLADFEKWIAMGAPDPRDGKPGTATTMDFDAARRHWAYQPMRLPKLPLVKNPNWADSAIDQFILAKLEAQHLTPSPAADRRTLLRRVYHDLIGLPPTAEEVEAFEKDASADAFARVVDRLLASLHYGERWGRHWLDVARYADTKDLVLLFGKDRVRPYAYTYRDYVIRALNADTPYDRFIHEQLAADQLDLGGESWRLAAMGFLTLGRLFDNNPHDIYDDQIDTVSRGLLGLTVSCARCHDHKYDAIPTADYYSLHGVFAGSEVPIDLPRIEWHGREAVPQQGTSPTAVEFEKRLAEKREQLRRHIDAQHRLLTETARTRVTDYLVRVATEKPDPLEDAVFFLSLSPEDLRPQLVSRWRRYLEKHSPESVFAPWHELMQLPDADFSQAAREIVKRLPLLPSGTEPGQLNPLVKEALASTTLTGKADVARMYGALLRRVHEEGGKEDPARQQLLAVLMGKDSPVYIPKRTTYLYMSRVERDTYGKLLREMDRLAVDAPDAPSRAMVLVDSPEPSTPRVLIRGNPGQPGEAVPRQFLRILAGDERKPFAHGSGRLELAKAITAPENPLTARVIVNRVWMHHFGEPLVQTPSDFGVRSSAPSHPELLDWLAWTFQQDGWSLKQLHRRILLSRVYQQASFDHPEYRKVDPDNRLLWRFHRRRLDLESMRDTMLAISGRLERTLGGRPVDVAGEPLNRRRTVYSLIDRQSLPGLFRAFDFAVPDQSVERRPQTTVPQQALFAMNAPFVIEQAKALAARAQGESMEQRVASLYRRVLARQPSPAEVRLAVAFLGQEQKDSQLTPWQQYAQVLLMMNELAFVD